MLHFVVSLQLNAAYKNSSSYNQTARKKKRKGHKPLPLRVTRHCPWATGNWQLATDS
jgi:hypothetical protein